MTFAASAALILSLFSLVVYRFFNALANVDHVPGLRPLFAPLSLFGAACGTRWWNPGLDWPWEWRKTAFFTHTHDVISVVPIIAGDVSYCTSSLDVMKQVLAHEGKTHLIKPPRIFISLWGDNVVAANGEMWKRHRRIVAPAFTSKTHSMVVAETTSIYKEMAEAEKWEGKDEILESEFNRLPYKLTLIVIARCGFGLPLPWLDGPTDANGLTFSSSLTIVTQSVIPRLVIPRWLYKLPVRRLRIIEAAWSSLGHFMNKFVATRQDELRGETIEITQRGDVFSRLVAAMDGDAKQALDKQEVIGNTFTLMFAGHETTAAILSATLGYLAIHEAEQEKAYAEIMRAIPAWQDPTPENLMNLPHLLACFHETMRLYPAAASLYREMSEDTPIKVMHPAEKTIVLKRGSLLVVDLISLHRNPRTFPEPDVFRPSRWYGVSEHDVSMFGYGPRACLAKKFTHLEALCFLVLFLRDWRVSIPLPAGESMEEYEERVMGNAGRVGLAFGVRSISLKLTRRK
ncbi:cytochrome P450 [Mycena vulgaris]|nr:cytochrome P450 [Mycena vulgaris]